MKRALNDKIALSFMINNLVKKQNKIHVQIMILAK